jgi:hypothetical protein
MGTYVPHVAHWSAERPARLIITDTPGDVVASYTIDPPAGQPRYDVLCRNGWTAYPGSEWTEEDPPGEWKCAVYVYVPEGRDGHE